MLLPIYFFHVRPSADRTGLNAGDIVTIQFNTTTNLVGQNMDPNNLFNTSTYKLTTHGTYQIFCGTTIKNDNDEGVEAKLRLMFKKPTDTNPFTLAEAKIKTYEDGSIYWDSAPLTVSSIVQISTGNELFAEVEVEGGSGSYEIDKDRTYLYGIKLI